MYDKIEDLEGQLIEALISEVQIYEEKQANGQWLKSITFKLPIIDEDLNISLDNDEQVDSCLEAPNQSRRITQRFQHLKNMTSYLKQSKNPYKGIFLYL